MTLENQVCSLELAKRLKELGVKQESLFWHVWDGERDYFLYHNEQVQVYEGKTSHILMRDGTIKTTGGQALDKYSAFTVAELGEFLPDAVRFPFANGRLRAIPQRLHFFRGMNGRGWMGNYTAAGTRRLDTMKDAKEADLRAKMLIYLLENKLITL